jgi:cell division protein FtsQ
LSVNKYQKRRVRKNHYKRQSVLKRFDFRGWAAFGGKMGLGIALVGLLSLVCSLSYDLVTQCGYFKAKSIDISGMQRLNKTDILKQASLYPEINILSVNLRTVRERLLSHPDIDDADIIRKFPDKLTVRIKEHEPLAVVDLGRRFLIDVNGKVYKEWTASDPKGLPEISGLQFSDLGLEDRGGKNPFGAVMQVLRMGKDSQSIIPNKAIRKICVDREIGITLYAYDHQKAIKLGYDNYPDKYLRLQRVTHYLKNQLQSVDFEWIDLMNAGRIVVNPMEIQPTIAEGKEV